MSIKKKLNYVDPFVVSQAVLYLSLALSTGDPPVPGDARSPPGAGGEAGAGAPRAAQREE